MLPQAGFSHHIVAQTIGPRWAPRSTVLIVEASMPTEINPRRLNRAPHRLNPFLLVLLLLYALCFALMLTAPFEPFNEMLTVAAP